MTEYLQVLSFRQKQDGTWLADNLGYAKPSDKGGYDLTLFVMPAAKEGYWRLALRPPKGQQQTERRPPPPSDPPF